MKTNQLDSKGYRHGYWEHCYSNGNIDSKGTYDHGIKVGYWESYYTGGTFFRKGYYENNVRIGYWEIYYITSKKLIIKFYC